MPILSTRDDVKRRQMTCGYAETVDGINSTVSPLASRRTDGQSAADRFSLGVVYPFPDRGREPAAKIAA